MALKDLLTPSEAARLLRVSPVTIRLWARTGKLPARTTPGGHRRFEYGDLQAFAGRHGTAMQAAMSGALRILVVEDDHQFAAFVVEALRTMNPLPEVDQAHEGFEAGRRLQRFQRNLVLLDLMLPGVDGFAICRRLRNDPETQDIRIIAMTGYDSPENRSRILEAGAEACLAKPFRMAELLEAVTGKPRQHDENQISDP